MYAKLIVVTVLATLLVVACLFALAFVMMPQFSANWQAFAFARPAQGYGRGYGPGMMGGRTRGGMMNGGMMGGMMGGPGYWNTPVAPNNPSDSPAAPTAPAAPPSNSDVAPTSTPAPSNPPATSRGRGGQTTGGLVAVSPDGKALPVDSTNKLPDNTVAQKIGNLNVLLALAPYPPTGFSKSDFDVTLTDDKGQPVTDAKVSLDLAMPAMWMPTNTPAAQHVGNGRYHATGLFTMRGLWRIQVAIDRGGAKQSAFFDVWL